jgi:hypothetical protein
MRVNTSPVWRWRERLQYRIGIIAQKVFQYLGRSYYRAVIFQFMRLNFNEDGIVDQALP